MRPSPQGHIEPPCATAGAATPGVEPGTAPSEGNPGGGAEAATVGAAVADAAAPGATACRDAEGKTGPGPVVVLDTAAERTVGGAAAALVGAGAVGAALLEQKIDGVFFTGSHATGAHIAQAVSNRFVKLQLELGGKDPTYVCDDADPQAAAESLADGAMYNTGQSCCSVERIYVHEKIYDKFVQAFVDTVKTFKTGDPMSDDTYIGAITRAPQLDVLDAQVADAKAKGAKLLIGGARGAGPGNWYQPTVFADVNHKMDLMREESFGPIIGIQKVKDDVEAVRLMNDTRYGLTAGVFSHDEARAKALMAQLNAGSVYWNCCDRVSPRLPWSGHGDSGVGVTLSTYGIQTFTRPKAWHLRQA